MEKTNKTHTRLTYRIKISNGSDHTKIASLLCSGLHLSIPNFGNDAAINVELIGSNYAGLIGSLLADPAYIKGIELKFDGQHSKKITVIQVEDIRYDPVVVNHTIKSGKYDFEFAVGQNHRLEVEMLPKETVEINLNVFKKINGANPLVGKPLIDEYILPKWDKNIHL